MRKLVRARANRRNWSSRITLPLSFLTLIKLEESRTMLSKLAIVSALALGASAQLPSGAPVRSSRPARARASFLSLCTDVDDRLA